MPINHAAAPPRILWSDGAEPGELVVQIRATDRAGLLARLTAVFERDGVDIAWAKVTTLGSSVVDVFGITAAGDGDSAGAPTRRRLVRDELERDLYAVLPAPAAREAGLRSQLGWTRVFESLSDRLTGALSGAARQGPADRRRHRRDRPRDPAGAAGSRRLAARGARRSSPASRTAPRAPRCPARSTRPSRSSRSSTRS